MRVYYDRLVDDSDRAWLVQYLKETMQTEFGTDFDKLFEKLDFNKDGRDSSLPDSCVYSIHGVCVRSVLLTL